MTPSSTNSIKQKTAQSKILSAATLSACLAILELGSFSFASEASVDKEKPIPEQPQKSNNQLAITGPQSSAVLKEGTDNTNTESQALAESIKLLSEAIEKCTVPLEESLSQRTRILNHRQKSDFFKSCRDIGLFEKDVYFAQVKNPLGNIETHFRFHYKASSAKELGKNFEIFAFIEREEERESLSLQNMLEKLGFRLSRIPAANLILSDSMLRWEKLRLDSKRADKAPEDIEYDLDKASGKTRKIFSEVMNNPELIQALLWPIVALTTFGIFIGRTALRSYVMAKQKADSEAKQKASETADSAIVYTISNSVTPTIKFLLSPGQTFFARRTSMLRRDNAISERLAHRQDLGNSNDTTGLLKRFLAGGSNFFIHFSNMTETPSEVVLSRGEGGTIFMVELDKYEDGVCVHKHGLLAFDASTKIDFIRGSFIGAVFGMGYFHQRLKGMGKAFLSSSSEVERLELPEGRAMVCDRKALLAWTSDTEVRFIRQKLSEFITNGEGLFVAKIQGPGTIWLSNSHNRSGD